MLSGLRVWTRVLSLHWAGVLAASRTSSCEGAALLTGHLARTLSRPGPLSRSSSPAAAATAVYLFFRRMAAGVHGNNALDPSPTKECTAPAIHHSHCLAADLARWALPRLWFFPYAFG